MNRFKWVNLKNPLYVYYHDAEWGKNGKSDQALYELLILESFQAGLSWECVLNKREAFRRAYDGFDIEKVIRYDEAKIEALLKNPEIIRNRLKIVASVRNSAVFKAIQAEYGSFSSYVLTFTQAPVIFEPYTLRTVSPVSDALSKDLYRRGMRFVGSTIIYSFLQAAGFLNAHGAECDLCGV